MKYTLYLLRLNLAKSKCLYKLKLKEDILYLLNKGIWIGNANDYEENANLNNLNKYI